MLTVVTFLVLISVLALAHEVGHFLMAKLSGVKVEEFGLGFPPRILSRKLGETIYSVNLLPLGGFVRLLGEDSVGVDSDDPRAFPNRPHYQQVGILMAGVTMNLILGLTLLALVFTRFGLPRVHMALRIDEVVADSPAGRSELGVGEEIIGFTPVGERFQDIHLAKEFPEFIKDQFRSEIRLQTDTVIKG